MARRRPDPLTLLAFAFVVLVGGSNFVAIRLSNRELPPFFGAGLRWSFAAVLMLTTVAVTRTALPRGRALVGAVVYGLLNFFVSYALIYWALEELPAAFGGVALGTVPLLTFVLAVAQRIERFRWRGAIGALIAVIGAVVMSGGPGSTSLPGLRVIAAFAAAAGAAQTGIVIKRFPAVHPFALNAVGMTVAAPLLLALSQVAGERWALPDRTTTWLTLLYLIPVGSCALFIAYVFVVQRWTASAASYQFVLFPIVAGITGFAIAGEALGWSSALGGAFVILGTYVGALSTPASEPAPRLSDDDSARR